MARPSRATLLDRLVLDRATVDLVIFDKDGTLIDFDAMWAGWVVAVAGALEGVAGRPLRDELYDAFGFDSESGHARPGGPLAGGPMSELRGIAVELVAARLGLALPAAEALVGRAWSPPDPIATATPLTDLGALFGALGARGISIAVATGDDRLPTLATLEHLGLMAHLVAVSCADDGLAAKPHPEMVHAICARTGIAEGRTAVVGDSPADMGMARAAGVGLAIGVLTGTGSVDDLAPLADCLIPSVAVLEA